MLDLVGKRPLISTPLQRGGPAHGGDLNRFSGFHLAEDPRVLLETAKAVILLTTAKFTPQLKERNRIFKNAN